jgi:hypothetical protein
VTPDGVGSRIQRAAAALDRGGLALTIDQVDDLLTECAGIQLYVMADVRRTDRRLRAAYETAAAGLGSVTQTRRLAERSKELAAVHSRLLRVISELRSRRDRLATGRPPQRPAD